MSWPFQRVLVAPDSFKGSSSAFQAARAIADGLRQASADYDIKCVPLADGGEGTGDILESLGGVRVPTDTVSLTGELRPSYWIMWNRIGLVESSVGSGYVADAHLGNGAELATSRGTGLLVAHALQDPRVDAVYVGLGGTATTDGGLGFLQALGAQFLDEHENLLTPTARNLSVIEQYIPPKVGKPIIGLYDVGVPLLGARGAVQQFGKQKGIPPMRLPAVEKAMEHYASCIETSPGDWSQRPGAGAAGGLGFAILAIGGQLRPGADLVAKWCDLYTYVADCDWVITGEGRIDGQTMEGKVVSHVAKCAQKCNKPAIALVGSRGRGAEELHYHGLSFIFPIVDAPMSLEDAMHGTQRLLTTAAREVGMFMHGSRGASSRLDSIG